ncbi:unnamed protein product [Discula destructiva]
MHWTNALRLTSLLAIAAPVVGLPQNWRDSTTQSLSSRAEAYEWTQGALQEYPIHSSCNATEARLIRQGLDETVELATHARDHISIFGNSSYFYRKWFGNAPSGEPIGWFEKLIHGDKTGLLFRCDDPDDNCRLDGWGGHWRGENGTSETVICPLTYETRRPLASLCMFGYTVASGELNAYYAADLMHRIYHLPAISDGAVDHWADEYADCLDLAKTTPADAVRNTHSLQYFALDVYAYDISLPGDGCSGSATATSTATTTDTPTVTSDAPTECHTHDDGTEHCT